MHCWSYVGRYTPYCEGAVVKKTITPSLTLPMCNVTAHLQTLFCNSGQKSPTSNNPQCDSEVTCANDHGSYGTKIVTLDGAVFTNRHFKNTVVQSINYLWLRLLKIGYGQPVVNKTVRKHKQQPALQIHSSVWVQGVMVQRIQ